MHEDADMIVSMNRRRFLRGLGAGIVTGPLTAFAQARPPIADMHSHYGMVSRTMDDSGLAADMRDHGVVLVAWKAIADQRWIRSTAVGIEQRSTPAPGELAQHFERRLDRMKAYSAKEGLRTVLTPADVDACLAGEAGIVLACEGADFLEGRVEGLDAAHAKGLRHLQLVHYIRTPVGDFQTTAPTHGGLSEMGRRLVQACNARGVLVDLAHCTGAAVEQALQVSTAPMVWSHGWVDRVAGDWRDRFGYLQRRLSLPLARKIAERGGVIGLWGFGLSRSGQPWPVLRGDTAGYARELKDLVDKLGADHVAIGTDIEGLGESWSVNDYASVRAVIDHLQSLKLEASIVERVAYRNYARVLRTALASGRHV
jgi:membrane dipeptidase